MQSIIEAFGIAGIFAVDESHKSLTICPRHRGLTEQSMVFVGDALQLPTDDAGILPSEEEDNFARARATIISITLQHPITTDHVRSVRYLQHGEGWITGFKTFVRKWN